MDAQCSYEVLNEDKNQSTWPTMATQKGHVFSRSGTKVTWPHPCVVSMSDCSVPLFIHRLFYLEMNKTIYQFFFPAKIGKLEGYIRHFKTFLYN